MSIWQQIIDRAKRTGLGEDDELLRSEALRIFGQAIDLIGEGVRTLSENEPVDIRSKAFLYLATWVRDRLCPAAQFALLKQATNAALMLDSAQLGLLFQLYFKVNPEEEKKWLSGDRISRQDMRSKFESEPAVFELNWLRRAVFPDWTLGDATVGIKYDRVEEQPTIFDVAWALMAVACAECQLLKQRRAFVAGEVADRFADLDKHYEDARSRAIERTFGYSPQVTQRGR